MEERQQNIKITEEINDWYCVNFPTPRQGIMKATKAFMDGLNKNPIAKMFSDPLTAHDFLMQSWRHIWRHTLISLQGRFTAEELSLILECHNAHAITPGMYGSDVLLDNVSDAIALDGLAEKWEVASAQIFDKISELTPIQALCLEMWAVGFWYGKKSQEIDIPGYIKTLE